MMNERSRQQQSAVDAAAANPISQRVFRYHFLCVGYTFSAIAPSQAGAFRVLNAELPGVHGTFVGMTDCPVETRFATLRHLGLR